METKKNTTTPASVEQPKKKSATKTVLIGLGVAATAVGGFFGWRWWSKKRTSSPDADEQDYSSSTTTSPATKSYPSTGSYYKPATTTRKDSFPLKKGSKGDRVKAFQEKLIAKYGKSILPKYGADGDFGSEMVAALEKVKLPAEINESTYNLYVKGAAPDHESLAEKLHEAAEDKNYSNALSYLKQLRNTSDYSKVSEKFKEYRINGGVRKTLVTGMLDTFKTASQQDAIRAQFLRMGLKYDGDKWSLSGLAGNEHPLLVTTQPTELIDPKHRVKVNVPAKMIIGHRLQEKNGLTLFKTLEKNKKLIVKSSTVKIYERN